MSALVRTAVGSFTLAEAVSPDDITRDTLAAQLQPAAKAVGHLARIEVEHGEVTELLHGRPIRRPGPTDEVEVAAFDQRGELVAILTPRDGKLWPTRVFVTQ